MPLRILEYMLRIWRAHLTETPTATSLPPIVPIVLHHSEQGWTASTSFDTLFEVDARVAAELSPFLPSFRFVLDDVSRATNEELRARAVTALAKLVLGCLRHARRMPGMLGDAGHWQQTLWEAKAAPHGIHALGVVLRYMFDVSDARDANQIQRFFALAGEPAITEECVTLTERLIEKGLKKGRVEGRVEGRAATLLTQLHAKFGKVSARTSARVKAADEPTLDRWTVRILTATTIAETLDD